MGYMPKTPFGRPVDACLIEELRRNLTPLPQMPVDKWHVLRELGAARKHFDLSDRTITVLQALISFHKGNTLEPDRKALVVFPANATICKRLNGMPCSTMRRHLARLVSAGLLLRRDSPNGKRYVCKGSNTAPDAFGFDLSPLLHRFVEICEKAEETRQEAAQLAELRRDQRLMIRDIRAFAEYGTGSDLLLKKAEEMCLEVSRTFRRAVPIAQMRKDLTMLIETLAKLEAEIVPPLVKGTTETSASNAQNEHHYSKSKKEDYDIMGDGTEVQLKGVISKCSELIIYSDGNISKWPQFYRTVEQIIPMMGIQSQTWATAKNTLGEQNAAISAATLLQRFSSIRNPGAYLNHLISQHGAGRFCVKRMLRAIQTSVHSCEHNGASSQL